MIVTQKVSGAVEVGIQVRLLSDELMGAYTIMA